MIPSLMGLGCPLLGPAFRLVLDRIESMRGGLLAAVLLPATSLLQPRSSGLILWTETTPDHDPPDPW
ncbi:hypothetical protein ASE03_21370 [Kitasatospora sp. Root187]|nr:hypothetical protein ASC99_26950 [Kitasatospora sp. Root107]KRB73741.1 hypothetical protein ASE03_21370 [Kitasatospora sp. Root187]